MYKLTENLATRTVAGLVGFVMALALTFGAFAPAAQAASVSDLCAEAAEIGVDITSGPFADLCGASDDSSETATGNGYIHHPNVDHMFNVNLRIGARGADVLMLQKALNDGGYTVATSGAGSAGNETSYFGPATTQAVAAFQAANGVAPAIGNFYPLTRAEMNRKGEVSTDTDTDTDTDSDNDGDMLEVSAGDQPSDDYLFPGVVRLPVLVFELEAGDEDVDVESLTFELTGRVDKDLFASVVLLDENGNIFGDEETIGSDDEVEFNEEFTVKDGETMMFTLAVNAETDAAASSTFASEDDDEFTFELIEVETDTDVDGLPLTSGAEHTVDQDNEEVDMIEVSIDHENDSEVEIGSEDELFVTLEIESVDNNNDDDESVFVKSLRFENTGTADLEDDLADIYVEVDGDKFDGEVNDDYVAFDFGDGFEIENGDKEDFELRATVVSGATDTFIFVVDEASDVYAETETGYGAPVDATFTLTDAGKVMTVSAGTATLSDSSEESSEDVTVGTGIVLGYFDFELEGEGLVVEDLTLSIEVTSGNVVDGDLDDLLLENVYIADADGNALTDEEDAEGTGAASFTMTVEFEDVTFGEGDWEDLQIIGDIADEVGNGTEYEIVDLDVTAFTGDVEGEDSEEDITVADDASFDARTVEAAQLEVSVSSADEDETSDEVDGYFFAVVEFDARDSGEDVEVTSVELLVTASSSDADAVEDITNCTLYTHDSTSDDKSDDEDLDESDFNGPITGATSTVEFTLNDFVVEAGENMKLDLRCDIGDKDILADDEFTWSIEATAEIDAEGVTTGTDGDDFVVIDPTSGDTVVIVAAGLDVKEDSDSPEAQVVKQGSDDVVLGTLAVQGDEGTATIEEIWLTIDVLDILDDNEVVLYVDGDREDDVEVTVASTGVVIEGLDIEVTEEDEVVLEFRADIDANAATTSVTLDVLAYLLDDEVASTSVTEDSFETVTAYEAVPVITLVSDVNNAGDLEEINTNKEILVFSIEADGEDVTVDSVIVDFKTINGLEVTDAEMFVYENSALTNEFGSDLEAVAASSTLVEGDVIFDFATDIVIDEGETLWFVLEADIASDGSDTGALALIIEDEAATGIIFTDPAIDSSVLLDEDIEVSHSRN